MRLNHVLSKIPEHSIAKMGEIISAMVDDINTECAAEFTPSKVVNKSIGKKTATLYKDYLNSSIQE